ncbi:hypothetical protein OGAPHI_007134 [Ogataea philodendri]|uniref:ATP-dependent RNA helicase DBP10 n=1 Tax=Ogataea philodendri TaxID=1378263 RepID=A0A9P8NUF4_9ASCO|nr:uncharacterized protein OGAPHI_007134 [Ogataea philodendri]KAH3660548.1 hypothetical protein OGAPHI_007134 [Ogataea philodendri]
MSDEEFDIASKLVDDDVDSESGYESEGEIQDEIIDSDTEEVPSKRQKVETKGFPSLELSDDEDKDSGDFFLNQPAAKKAKNGTFASFGLSKHILTNLSKKGYRQPTPIQRKTIPLIISNRDVVGMARTGSGKTAAFLLPLIEKLKTHVAKIGVRAIILSPSRELAMQTSKQFKEFSRGSDLRSLLLIGGDSMEDQFGAMMANPDVIIATPGRFLHLKTEMQLDLRTVEYIIYDEADRLFEMGFAEQLNELLASLPEKRQSMLFSATLPRNLVDFAKAGLTNPVLVRLDSETKISEDLQMCFLSIKKNEREANLLLLLQDVIKMPVATPEEIKKLDNANKLDDDSDSDTEIDKKKSKKRPRREKVARAGDLPTEHSTIIFVPTKHHVEYVTLLLKDAGYATAYIYGSLDQHARRRQLLNFRAGLCRILVVTDVAARGIDIPVLANVINYSFPSSSKIFVHRVGRTARAGNKGWAYSILSEAELPYLLDLEVFLGRKVLLTSMHEKKCQLLQDKYEQEHGTLAGFVKPNLSYTERLVLGSAPRGLIGESQELYETLLKHNYEIRTLKGVAEKGEKLFFRTRGGASVESLRRAKEISNMGWDQQNLLFGANLEHEKDQFLAKLQNRRNKETVFEFGKKDDSLMDLMNTRRRQIAPVQRKAQERRELLELERVSGLSHTLEDELFKDDSGLEVGYSVNESELAKTFEDGDQVLDSKKSKKKSFKDPNFYISHYAPASTIQEQQLSVDTGFASEANRAAFDIDAEDEKVSVQRQTARVLWDRKAGKYKKVQDDKKYIIGESGQKIPASYRSGKFDEWKTQHNVNFKTGAQEQNRGFKGDLSGRKQRGKFVHSRQDAPKLPDKNRDNYKEQVEKVKKAVEGGRSVKGWNTNGGRNELKSVEQIRKQREVKDKRRAKNARPSRKRK